MTLPAAPAMAAAVAAEVAAIVVSVDVDDSCIVSFDDLNKLWPAILKRVY